MRHPEKLKDGRYRVEMGRLAVRADEHLRPEEL